ncbi:MAG TPA: ABC transporter substrate-binding protein [Magnetospirillum sp.]|nr:ABC transporter substrate-binding protein [Magnetospirillum sp.]
MDLRWLLAMIAVLALGGHSAIAAEPVRVGIDAEFGLPGSSSAQAIERGVAIAIAEINASGGVLGGRPLELVKRDNRSVPARSRENLAELAAMPDMVAVICGRFSPVVLENLELVHQLRIILLDPWAAADGITENGYQPNYVFRLSLRDRWAMPAMMRHAVSKGATRIGVLAPNTGWGRSGVGAIERTTGQGMPTVSAVSWYNWGDKSLARPYVELLRKGAQAVLFIANDAEGAVLLREVAAMPEAERLPLIMHWGVTGGPLVQIVGSEVMDKLDLSVVQTFSFLSAEPRRLARFLDSWQKLYGPIKPEAIQAPVGVAHAYDLTHILAQAIAAAGTTDRVQVRAALEKLREHDGLVRRYAPPFTPTNHDALSADNVFMAVYRADGAIVPLTKGKGDTR